MLWLQQLQCVMKADSGDGEWQSYITTSYITTPHITTSYIIAASH